MKLYTFMNTYSLFMFFSFVKTEAFIGDIHGRPGARQESPLDRALADAADALAVAICHAHYAESDRRLAASRMSA